MPYPTIEFMRPAVGGRVHVVHGVEHIPGIPGLFQRHVARCGRRGRSGILDTVRTFNDLDLCARCWQRTPAEHRPSLFFHPEE